MSNPYGEQDLVGNVLTCSDLLNVATKSAPVALGSGLAATYVSGQVAFTANASSNIYSTPYAEGLVMLVSLASGSVSGVALNTGAASTSLAEAGNTGSISDTKLHAVFVSMPSAAVGTATPGAPTAPFFSVSLVTSGAQINQLAVFALGKLADGADYHTIRGGGINVVASGVINAKDTLTPTNLIGSGAFTVSSTD
jgi:hypothetical protein